MWNAGKWILGAAVMAGALGMGATQASAATVRVYVGGGEAAYVPACPGPGYVWVDGYWSNGYFVRGGWVFRGDRFRDRVYVDHYRGRDFDRDRDFRRDQRFDRERARYGDHFRR